MKLNLDYETRSTCNLKLAGTYVYARHPSTLVLCAAYSIDGEPVQVWPAAAGLPMPADLRRALEEAEIHAWNAQFERLITKHVVGIDVPLERWHCTAAHARLRSLPGKLEGALNFLGMAPGLYAKRRGAAVMLKWCQPMPDGGWAADENEYIELLHYCMDDVRSEAAIGALLAVVPMTALERAEYETNERVNDAGLPIDRELALAAAAYGIEERAELAGWMSEMTGGVITSATQHTRVKEWIAEHLPAEVVDAYFTRNGKITTDKAARADFLNSDVVNTLDDPTPVALLELVDDANKASVSKFAKMATRAVDNGRAEGSYLLAGAGQTKRYSSVGIQMHNLPRKGLDDVPKAIQQVMEHKVPGKVMHVLAALLRPAVKAPLGRVLVWGDWSSVEARGMPWLAGCEWKLDLYRNNIDVYKRNAQDIFGTPYNKVDDRERQVGKVSELSLQFGGARGALKAMSRNYGVPMTDDMADLVVDRWRNANKWAAQFSQGLLTAFASAVVLPGAVIHHCGIEYEAVNISNATGMTVRCTLPGGTRLYYQRVEATVYLRYFSDYVLITPQTGYEGERFLAADVLRRLGRAFGAGREQPGNVALALSLPPWLTTDHERAAAGFKREHPASLTYTKALTTAGHRERIWHGLLAENVTQALCAALLRDCLGRVEKALAKVSDDVRIVGHTHDEIILEAPLNKAKQASTILHREMQRTPKWLTGFPLGCEVKSGPRYVK